MATERKQPTAATPMAEVLASHTDEELAALGFARLAGDPKPVDVGPVKLVDLMIAYEAGETSDSETLELFGHLIRTGQAWQLQGHYGRTATMLIEVGALNEDGTPGPAAYFDAQED